MTKKQVEKKVNKHLRKIFKILKQYTSNEMINITYSNEKINFKNLFFMPEYVQSLEEVLKND